jgi:hypothetical protein
LEGIGRDKKTLIWAILGSLISSPGPCPSLSFNKAIPVGCHRVRGQPHVTEDATPISAGAYELNADLEAGKISVAGLREQCCFGRGNVIGIAALRGRAEVKGKRKSSEIGTKLRYD